MCICAYVRTCGPVCIQSIIRTYIHTYVRTHGAVKHPWDSGFVSCALQVYVLSTVLERRFAQHRGVLDQYMEKSFQRPQVYQWVRVWLCALWDVGLVVDPVRTLLLVWCVLGIWWTSSRRHLRKSCSHNRNDSSEMTLSSRRWRYVLYISLYVTYDWMTHITYICNLMYVLCTFVYM